MPSGSLHSLNYNWYIWRRSRTTCSQLIHTATGTLSVNVPKTPTLERERAAQWKAAFIRPCDSMAHGETYLLTRTDGERCVIYFLELSKWYTFLHRYMNFSLWSLLISWSGVNVNVCVRCDWAWKSAQIAVSCIKTSLMWVEATEK